MKRFDEAQEIFDHVVNHLGDQGRPAFGAINTYTDFDYNPDTDEETEVLRESFGCAYRTKDGLACAAGCLIIDSQYDPQIEDNRFATLDSDVIKRIFMPGVYDHISLVEALQGAHDRSRDTLGEGDASQRFVPEVLHGALVKIAKTFGLAHDAIAPAIEKIKAFNQANPA